MATNVDLQTSAVSPSSDFHGWVGSFAAHRRGFFYSVVHMYVDLNGNSPLGLGDTWTEWCDVEITKDGSDRPVSIKATREDGTVYVKTIVYLAGKTTISKWTKSA